MRTMTEILEDFWYRTKWFIKHDFITFKGWTKVIILGGLTIGYFALKEFFEKKKRKGVQDDY